MKLRNYQQDVLTDVLRHHADKDPNEKLLVVMPTGSGKSYTMGAIAEAINVPTLSIVHRSEVADQNQAALDAVMNEGKDRLSMTTQAAYRRAKSDEPLGLSGPAKLLFIDEAHLNKASMVRTILDASWIDPECRVVGVTATPVIGKGGGMGEVYDHLIQGPHINELRDLGYLPECSYVTGPRFVDSRGLKVKTTGDLSDADILRRNSIESLCSIAADTLEYAKRNQWITDTDQGIVFAPNRASGRAIAEFLSNCMYDAAFIDGRTSKLERADLIERFTSGDLQILVNVDVFSEGFDAPAVKWGMLMRPTASPAKFLQQAGRLSRGTERVVLFDVAANVARHGLPESWCDRWTLEPKLPEQTTRITRIKEDGSIQVFEDPEEIRELRLTGFTELLEGGGTQVHEPQPQGIDAADLDRLLDRFLSELHRMRIKSSRPTPAAIPAGLPKKALQAIGTNGIDSHACVLGYTIGRRDSIEAITEVLRKARKKGKLTNDFKGKLYRKALMAILKQTPLAVIDDRDVSLMRATFGGWRQQKDYMELCNATGLSGFALHERLSTSFRQLKADEFEEFNRLLIDSYGSMSIGQLVDAVLTPALNGLKNELRLLGNFFVAEQF